MVKLLNTPFGQYGYVLNRDPAFDPFLPDIATSAPLLKHTSGIRPSIYDAKYLRTTNLSKGSNLFRVNDQRSYVKHGLLHQGQAPFVFLDQDVTNRANVSNVANSKPASSLEKSQQSERARTKFSLRLPASVQQNFKNSATGKKQHAGKSTLAQQHHGFANSYAASRSDLGSLAKRLGSGNDDSFKLAEDSCDEDESNKMEKMLGSGDQLILIDPSEMPLSELSKLKNRRLHDVYTDMYKKHDKARRRIIKEKIHTVEKMKDNLHHIEIEQQRNLLKTSSASQRNQLKELRERHAKTFTNRLNYLYTPKLHPFQTCEDVTPNTASTHNVFKASVSRLSLPRKVYGLPENIDDPRPETVPSKPLYQFPPGKLSLDSYVTTRHNLPHKFNNVWNKTSPVSTPRKSEPSAK